MRTIFKNELIEFITRIAQFYRIIMATFFSSKITKTNLLMIVILCAVSIFHFSCGDSPKNSAIDKKVIVLGFDGMDPVLLKKYMQAGLLPHFRALSEEGGFRPLTTSMPPQSAVAWSDFITGMNAGGHGVVDFIARDPATYLPYLSTSETVEPTKKITIGDWVIPLSGGEVRLLRKGKAFWEILESNGIPTTIVRLPSNFPPVKTGGRSLSGMGTPDVLGTYGTFSFYTTKSETGAETSGKVFQVEVKNNTVKASLLGPINTFKKARSTVNIDFVVKIDPENPIAKITVQGHEVLLNEKEWSDWVQVKFKFMPFQSMTGIFRFYLKELKPDFQLYVSPINLDPINPAFPICTPDGYSKELVDAIGYFYTQGMPEDTWALNNDRIANEAFLELSDYILMKRKRMLQFEMERLASGLLVVYFSTTDPIQHMFWRYIDPDHPGYDPDEAKIYSSVIPDTYKKMDQILGNVVQQLDDETALIVLSDHGFGPLRKHFNLNTWLRQNNFLSFIDGSVSENGEFFQNVDWGATRAYGLGLNALYVNLKGRENSGVVLPQHKQALLSELTHKLLAVRDPKNGKKIINSVYKATEIYSGKYVVDAPDLIIGYNRGYRASWESALGKITNDMLSDNIKRWSGGHLIDYKLVPGIVLSNRKIKAKAPALQDIAPTILSVFGVEKENSMLGGPIF
jgi:predicted AlkP superfamily phosphohydrolase/phosphomutase